MRGLRQRAEASVNHTSVHKEDTPHPLIVDVRGHIGLLEYSIPVPVTERLMIIQVISQAHHTHQVRRGSINVPVQIELPRDTWSISPLLIL